ncbi:MAG: RelA/SpoT domain protein, partial [Firmicutes bacterium]|nr:RelA/SpoT domain protein [Bacillota bacterium]
MTFESYYGDALPRLKQLESRLLSLVGQYPVPETAEGLQPILYCKSRIKTPESMMRKLQSRGLPTDSATALRQMHDAVGIRVVCSFAEDVYLVSHWLQCAKDLQVVQVKDYIAYPKPNGYRSLHL